MHTREDEYSIVTEGEIGFRSSNREVVLGRTMIFAAFELTCEARKYDSGSCL
jgi:uncharacterized cupin superfamily protein